MIFGIIIEPVHNVAAVGPDLDLKMNSIVSGRAIKNIGIGSSIVELIIPNWGAVGEELTNAAIHVKIDNAPRLALNESGWLIVISSRLEASSSIGIRIFLFKIFEWKFAIIGGFRLGRWLNDNLGFAWRWYLSGAILHEGNISAICILHIENAAIWIIFRINYSIEQGLIENRAVWVKIADSAVFIMALFTNNWGFLYRYWIFLAV